MAVENESVQIVEVDEVIDGQIKKVRRTIKTRVSEEILAEPETPSVSEPEEVEAERRVTEESATYVYENVAFSRNEEIDTRSNLVCRCFSPSGKAADGELTDNHDGTYTIDINASEPGVHTVEIEMDGRKIPGSPFLVRIVQAADKKKVRIYGPGLESGLLGNFNGLFYVDSKGAGPGDLKIRIHGPKEKFRIEMYRDSTSDRVINVKYHPEEPGIYTVNVYWSGEHVAGSPCEFFVAKNEEQLMAWEDNQERMREAEGLAD